MRCLYFAHHGIPHSFRLRPESCQNCFPLQCNIWHCLRMVLPLFQWIFRFYCSSRKGDGTLGLQQLLLCEFVLGSARHLHSLESRHRKSSTWIGWYLHLSVRRTLHCRIHSRSRCGKRNRWRAGCKGTSCCKKSPFQAAKPYPEYQGFCCCSSSQLYLGTIHVLVVCVCLEVEYVVVHPVEKAHLQQPTMPRYITLCD